MNNRTLIIIIVIALFLLLISLFFPIKDEENESSLNLVNEIQLTVPEPSGLYFDDITNTLWTVSDENSHIYNISLAGNIIDSFQVDGFDLEGITIIQDSILVTILERDRTIIFLDREGNELSRFKLNLTGEPNKGIEGIAYSNNTDRLFIVNEKNPRLLLIVDKQGHIDSKFKLDFATDFSGLHYDEQNERLWIISDENSEIFSCSQDGKLIDRYKVNIEQIEGVTIDKENSLIYIISDPLEKLFVYTIP